MTTYAIKNAHGHVRFIEARNEAQAIRHCARAEFCASLPTLQEAIEFGRNGGVIEPAGEADPPMQADHGDLAKINSLIAETLPVAQDGGWSLK